MRKGSGGGWVLGLRKPLLNALQYCGATYPLLRREIRIGVLIANQYCRAS